MQKLFSTIVILLLFIMGSLRIASAGEGASNEIPTRYGLAGVLGNTFDPVSDIHYFQVTGFIMWDYDKVWHHRAPDPLRWKLEGTVGITISPEPRAMIFVGMMALYYLEFLSAPRLLPYLEGVIGVIYTDFQVEGQGLRFNFNPLIGIGTEFKSDSGPPFFAGFRLSHISNGGLHDENRGVNSFFLMVGRFF